MSETLTAPVPAPVEAASVAPVPAAPVEAPVVAQLTEAAPAPEAAPEPAPAPTTVLGEALKPAEAPVEPAPAEAPEAAPQVVEGQSEEPAPPPTFEPFTLPEGVTVAPEQLTDFTGLLGQFETESKADHAKMQALGQQLLDRHLAAVQRIQQAQLDAWESQKVAWKDAFMADPELGGPRAQTTVDSALQFIRTHGGTEAEQAEFAQLMNTSGLGNHPAMIRMLARAGRAMSEGRPLVASAPPKAPTSRTEKLYGSR